MLERIRKHLLVYLSTPAVTLNEVTHLQHHACVCVYQSGCPLEESGTTVLPHLSIAGKLGSLYLVESLVGLVVMSVINRGRVNVEVCVAQNDQGVGFTSLSPCKG
jgi:hypothetical protein